MSIPADDPIPESTRKQRLAHAVAQEVVRGGSVESQSDFNAVLRFGLNRPRTNHVLHAVLTVLTGGVWALVWIPLWLSRRSGLRFNTVTLFVDAYGQLQRQELSV